VLEESLRDVSSFLEYSPTRTAVRHSFCDHFQIADVIITTLALGNTKILPNLSVLPREYSSTFRHYRIHVIACGIYRARYPYRDGTRVSLPLPEYSLSHEIRVRNSADPPADLIHTSRAGVMHRPLSSSLSLSIPRGRDSVDRSHAKGPSLSPSTGYPRRRSRVLASRARAVVRRLQLRAAGRRGIALTRDLAGPAGGDSMLPGVRACRESPRRAPLPARPPGRRPGPCSAPAGAPPRLVTRDSTSHLTGHHRRIPQRRRGYPPRERRAAIRCIRPAWNS